MLLTADEVRAARFQATKFREGYDQQEVDAFLERVVEALEQLASGAVPALTGSEVLDVKFQATKFREGYDQDQVDDFLDRVVGALGGARGEGTPRPAAPAAPVDAVTLRSLATALRPARMRHGYDPEAVTAFLDSAVAEIDRRARDFRASMTADDVSRVRFGATWWKPGFDQDEVDALMARVAASLR